MEWLLAEYYDHLRAYLGHRIDFEVVTEVLVVEAGDFGDAA